MVRMRVKSFNVDRRAIYLMVLLALSAPLIFGLKVKPARMNAAQKLYNLVENTEFKKDEIAFLAFDFGPNTKAENQSQAEVLVEHLIRKRIPFAVFSLYPLAEPFLDSVPRQVFERVRREQPSLEFRYGRDWVNLGYRPGGVLIVQSIAKSDDLVDLLSEDAYGNPLSELPAFRNVKTIEKIKLLVQMTGLTGVFDAYVQFFQRKNYRPNFGHGCTSITVPEAFIYLDSGQLKGLFEGIAGAAWYSELLNQNYPNREADGAILINTGLGIAHLVVILCIVLGNMVALVESRGSR